MTKSVVTLGLLVALTLGCGPDAGPVRPQWRVTVRTDAPLPDIADRLLVEITHADGSLACAACRRIFDVRAASFPLSLGVAATSTPLRVRARLYLARDATVSGEPRAELALDRRFDLPASPGKIALELPMRCYGLASTALASCDPATGELAPITLAPDGDGDPGLVPGSFTNVAPCGGPPPPQGMVCVDGGFFLFREEPASGTEATRGRAALVRISSFQLDRDEFTVGRFRALFGGGKVSNEPEPYVADDGDGSVCAYRGKDDASADGLALNCVSRALAAACCAAEGSRLPRDAELGYVAGNGGRGTDYSWGSSPDVCAHAVVARGRLLELPKSTLEPHYDCRIARDDLSFVFGPVPAAASGADGDVALGVHGLAGNLSEWVEDDFATVDAPCWRARPYLADPICVTKSHVPTLRGGSWADPTFAAHASLHGGASGAPANTNGFRCARSL